MLSPKGKEFKEKYLTDYISKTGDLIKNLPEQITFKDVAYNNRIAAFHIGDTVYAFMSGVNWCESKFVWRNSTGVIVNESADWLTGTGPYTDSYELPVDADIGTWTITRFFRYWDKTEYVYNNVTRNFYVVESNKFIPDDSWVNGCRPNRNYGSDKTLHVKNASVPQGVSKRQTYLKFDLNSIPTDACICGANLYLYPIQGSSVNRTLGAYYVSDDSWQEMEINWTNKPTPATEIDSTSVGYMNWATWDLSSQVQSEINAGGDKVLNVVLYFPETNGQNHKDFFSTEEDRESDYKGPYLEVCYDVIPPNVTAEIGQPQLHPQGYDKPLIGPYTPVWLNASDPGGSGAYCIQYTINPGTWITVYDNDGTDQDPTIGIISFNLTFSDSCWHEIDYRASDYCNNWNPSLRWR